jgi:hypothetical protein
MTKKERKDDSVSSFPIVVMMAYNPNASNLLPLSLPSTFTTDFPNAISVRLQHWNSVHGAIGMTLKAPPAIIVLCPTTTLS